MFIVLELQKMSDTQVANIVTSHVERPEAEQKFHTILAAAAVSNVPIHSAVLMDDSGYTIKAESYTHNEEEGTNES